MLAAGDQCMISLPLIMQRMQDIAASCLARIPHDVQHAPQLIQLGTEFAASVSAERHSSTDIIRVSMQTLLLQRVLCCNYTGQCGGTAACM